MSSSHRHRPNSRSPPLTPSTSCPHQHPQSQSAQSRGTPTTSTMPPRAITTSPNSAAAALLALAGSAAQASVAAATKPKIMSPASRQIFLDLSDEETQADHDDGAQSDTTESESEEDEQITDQHVPRQRQQPQERQQRPRPAKPTVAKMPLPLPTSVPLPSALAQMALEQQIVATAAALHSAKRIVVVTGAGISVSAGIPDFRSESGLYNLVKLQNPGVVVKGQDLFDYSLFSAEPTRRLFYSFMAGLRDACIDAHPTPVHTMMRELEVRGKLLRCYTQNIDGLEERAGLGLPVPEPATETETETDAGPNADEQQQEDGSPNRNGLGKIIECIDLRSFSPASPCRSSSPCPPAPPPPTAAALPVKRNPTVVQLHGTLAQVRCVLCSKTFPFTATLSAIFAEGDPPACPACVDEADRRAALGKRARGTGTLRPDVVLYNEPQYAGGEAIADVVTKDVRRRPDVVLVMGTSLKVHGIKKLVRTFAAAARGAGVVRGSRDDRESDWSALSSSSGSSSTTPSSDDDFQGSSNARERQRSRSRGPRVPLSSLPSSSPSRPSSLAETAAKDRPKVILVNKTPLPAKEWGAIFDTAVIGMDADDVVARWMGEWAKMDRKQADLRAKRLAAKERRLAGGVEKGQTRLAFPVVKNGASAAAVAVGKGAGDQSGKPVRRGGIKGGRGVPVPLSVKARVSGPGNENVPPSTAVASSKKVAAVAAPKSAPPPLVRLETNPEVVVIGSSSDDGIEIVEHWTPVRSRLRPRAKTTVYA